MENEVSSFSHLPVMLCECIEALDIKPDGIYVDCTTGGAGHSSKIAERLEAGRGRLICLDRDEDAIKAASERLAPYFDRVRIIRSNFSEVEEVLRSLGIEKIDGALIDLGASSHQFDSPERGFSYRFSGRLDMRMDNRDKLTAYDVVNSFSYGEIKRILFEYGEERFAPKIASEIIKEREIAPIETTDKLVEIIRRAIPMAAQKDGHPAKKTFQALRICVNNELDIIEPTLRTLCRLLKKEGRLAVLTFHSLEDRIVKQTFTELSSGCTCPPSFPVCVCGKKPSVKMLGKKPELPSKEELSVNTRSHSAKLRAVEKIR